MPKYWGYVDDPRNAEDDDRPQVDVLKSLQEPAQISFPDSS